MTTNAAPTIARDYMPWLDRAACRGSLEFIRAPDEQQQDMCHQRACPVVWECLSLALETHETRARHAHKLIGDVHGGLTPLQITSYANRQSRPERRCARCNQIRPASQYPGGGELCGGCPPYLPDRDPRHGMALGYVAGCECAPCHNGRPPAPKRIRHIVGEVTLRLGRGHNAATLAAALGYPNSDTLAATLDRAGHQHLATRIRKGQQ